MKRFVTTANDNENSLKADALGLNAVHLRRDLSLSQRAASRDASFWMTIVLWITGLGLMAWAFQNTSDVRTHTVIFGFGLWSSLWASFVAKSRNMYLMKELGAVTVITALTAGLTALSLYFNWQVSTSQLLIINAAVALVLSLSLKSPWCLGLSTLLTAIWIIQAPHLLVGPVKALAWIFPMVWAGQMFVAKALKSKLLLLASLACGYLWTSLFLLGLVTAGHITLTMGVSFLFLIGALHHRIGTFLQDVEEFASLWHSGIGIAVAAISAIAIQDHWLGLSRFPWEQYQAASIDGTNLWALSVAFMAFAIGLTALIRYRSGEMHTSGVIAAVGAIVIVPLLVIAEPFIGSVFEARNLSVYPFIGLAIGGIVLAFGLGFVMKGLRYDIAGLFFIGLTLIGAELGMVIKVLPFQDGLFNALVFSISGLLSTIVIFMAVRKTAAATDLMRAPVTANI